MLVLKSSNFILFRILVDLNPLTFVILGLSGVDEDLVLKSTVSGFEQAGQETCPRAAEKSKQGLQSTCSQAVT